MKKTIQDRLRELRSKIRKGELLGGGGLGNEVNYHIFDYDPEDELVVANEITSISKSMDSVKVFNVYDIVCEILKENNYLDKVFDLESTKGSQTANSAIIGVLSVGKSGNLIVDKIAEGVSKGDTILITGIGQVYQIIRTHILMSTLQNVVNDSNNPVIILYPGSYDGQTLSLFNVFPVENYYRAFKLVER